MSKSSIKVSYNTELEEFETLLKRVRRPGDFYSHGAITTPMPCIHVDGIGILSFPVPSAQIRQLIQKATRAPYGRGAETLVDESVRKVWQIPAEQVRISGKSWPETLSQLLKTVARDLGCEGVQVTAELYKLLIYDCNGFFAPHRDTEKAPGMFGTLVVVLPSAHQGGDLIVRHAGREVVIPMNGGEVSELFVAAFYADCEHEVRPVTEGSRVCLVFNLVQGDLATSGQLLIAPLYEEEIAAIGEKLHRVFREPHAPVKLVWLLGHHYSPDGLSFARLKGADAGVVGALIRAAATADCTLHLAIVHIDESGPAEPVYSPRDRRYSRRRWYDDEPSDADDMEDQAFEVIEVSNTRRVLDHWMDALDRQAKFGSLPLEDDELLPKGALEGEPPDTQRLTEATGNEGASFERSYHRAALVIWPSGEFINVLLRGGIAAALPYLETEISDAQAPSGRLNGAQIQPLAIACKIVEHWENIGGEVWVKRGSDEATPGHMILLKQLVRLGDPKLLARFIVGILKERFNGSEAEAMAASAEVLGPEASATLLGDLAHEWAGRYPVAFIQLVSSLLDKSLGEGGVDWKRAVVKIANPVVDSLSKQQQTPSNPWDYFEFQRTKTQAMDDLHTASLLLGLKRLAIPKLMARAVEGMARNPGGFDPVTNLIPALATVSQALNTALLADPSLESLWTHAAHFLLARSEKPPEPPADWRREIPRDCTCADCLELCDFVRNPEAKEAHFKMPVNRRSHLERQIDKHKVDLIYTTSRTGSPRTLICSKTTATFEKQCHQHKSDCLAMGRLIAIVGSQVVGPCVRDLFCRMEAARRTVSS